MRDREVQCIYYEYEGHCSKGKEGTFKGSCVHCPLYVAKKGAKPLRVDERRKKLEKASKKDWRE